MLAGMAVFLGGCTHPHPDIKESHQVYQKHELPAAINPDYLLSPGDELEVIYQFSTELEDAYHIAVGDQIRVEFYYYPQLDRTLNVRPDGKVTLPQIGDVTAVGFTPQELAERITKAYASMLRRPKATVALIRYGEKIRELKEAIKTYTRGQSRLVRINPDGKISLPLLPKPIQAAGLTIEQLHERVNEAYHRIVPGMDASATLLAANGNMIYVFGALRKPGFYTLKGPTTALQAIAMAGGLEPEGTAKTVLWITRDEEKHPVGRILDLESIMTHGNLGLDVLLRQGDVLYVPYSHLGDAAVTADMIWRIIPASFYYAYTRTQVIP